jgi:beta-1,4-mannosyltransferase
MPPLRVAFVPHFSRNNPYQALLAGALARQHVSVQMHDFDRRKPSVRELVERLEGQVDAVHIHWLHRAYTAPGLGRYALNLARAAADIGWLRRAAMPVFYTAHNLHAHGARLPSAEMFVHRRLIETARATFVHSPAARARLIAASRLSGYTQRRIVELEHGHYLNAYGTPPATDAARHRFGIAPNALVFLAFGLVRGYKGLGPLVQAFSRWEHPRAVLMIAGPVPASERGLAEELQVAADRDRRVALRLGRCPDDELPALFAAADASVIPYDWQLTSGALILAMGFGKPLLLPARDFAGERPAVHGNVIAERGWSAAFEAFASLPEPARQALGAANRAAAAELSWERCAATIAAVYRAVVQR